MNELTDDLVEEVLLRLPPADPACLARAAVVCRRRCRIISDPAFGRRFRELHRHPPTLGFFHRTGFMPTSSFRLPYADNVPKDWVAVDARHGRTLFQDAYHLWPGVHGVAKLVVCSPRTGDVRRLPVSPAPAEWCSRYWIPVVLCAEAGCDHLDCRPCGPFVVVSVETNVSKSSTSACIYSWEETDTWEHLAPTSAVVEHPMGRVVRHRCAFAGNALYFLFILDSNNTCRMLEYNLGNQQLSLIDLPSPPAKATSAAAFLVENGGRLGVATVVQRTKIYMWSRDNTTHQDGWRWAQDRVIDLESFNHHISAVSAWPCILAFVDVVDVVSVWIPSVGVFNLDLVSGLVTKIGDIDAYTSFHPYKSFYIPSVGRSLMLREK